MSKHYRKEHNCLNCGKNIKGKFCSNCGQENIEIKEPFWSFVSHGLAHYFHYDSKFSSTIKPFLTKPGQLTKDYIEGRRASHIPPISLYLFITLIYFLCAPIFKEKKDNTTKYNYNYNVNTGERVASKSDQETGEDSIYSAFENYSYDQQLNEIAKLDSQISDAGPGRITEAKADILKQLRKLSILAADSTVESYWKRQASLSERERDNALSSFWKERKISYKQQTGHDFKIRELMDQYFPKLLFILMPLFAFFLMLNFRRNKKVYMEHLIYTIHLFSFAYLSFFVSEFLIFLTPSVIGTIVEMVFFGILVWYTYRSIRVVYQRSRWVTVRKLFSISILYMVAFMITYMLGMTTVLVFS